MKWLLALALIWLAWRYLKPRRPSPETKAMALLGVGRRADEQAIRDAHRRKIADAHPDRGGSAELTRELNAARDLLLDHHR